MLDTQSTTFFLNLEEAYVIDSTDTTLTIELPLLQHLRGDYRILPQQ